MEKGADENKNYGPDSVATTENSLRKKARENVSSRNEDNKFLFPTEFTKENG